MDEDKKQEEEVEEKPPKYLAELDKEEVKKFVLADENLAKFITVETWANEKNCSGKRL